MINYFADLVFSWAVLSAVGMALHWTMQETGLSNLSAAGIFGIGAYGSAIAEPLTGSIAAAMLIAGLAAGGITGGLYALSRACREDDFLPLTLAAQLLLVQLFLNADSLTGGPYGRSGIAPISMLPDDKHLLPALIAILLAAAIAALTIRLKRSPWRRDLNMLRDDRILAQALGRWTGLRLFELGILIGAVLGVEGALSAHYQTFVEPADFTLRLSVTMILVTLLGGGTRFGPFLGAAIIVMIPEILRALPIATASEAYIRQLLFGILLTVIVVLQTRSGNQQRRSIDVSV